MLIHQINAQCICLRKQPAPLGNPIQGAGQIPNNLNRLWHAHVHQVLLAP